MMYIEVKIFITMDGSENRSILLYVKCSDRRIRELICISCCALILHNRRPIYNLVIQLVFTHGIKTLSRILKCRHGDAVSYERLLSNIPIQILPVKFYLIIREIRLQKSRFLSLHESVNLMNTALSKPVPKPPQDILLLFCAFQCLFL